MQTEFPEPSTQRSAGASAHALAAPRAANRPLSEAEQERMHNLALELRCLVCQNQSIADSHSGLAIDLRKQIAGQIQDGKSDAAIKQYMVERYGDFVLYKPAFSLGNAALWSGPFILLLIGIVLAARSIKRRKANPVTAQTETALPHERQNDRLQEIEARYQRESRR